MKKKTGQFSYAPAQFIPFRDLAVIERIRKIKKEQITKHWNPAFKIQVIPDADVEFLWMTEMFSRIKTAMDAGKPLVMIMPNPWPNYRKLAFLINKFRVDCRKLYTFNMDEYANEKDEIAPETWEFGSCTLSKNTSGRRSTRSCVPPKNRCRDRPRKISRIMAG